MVSSRHVTYWSPDANFLAFLSTDDSQVQQIEFSVYDHSQYPKMVGLVMI